MPKKRGSIYDEESASLLDDYDEHQEIAETQVTLNWWQKLRRKRDDINWTFWKEIIIVLAALFVAESSRGLMAPSLYLYNEDIGGDKKSLGMIVAAFSVGRLFGSIFLGWWYNKRGGKEAIIFSLIISAIAHTAYSFATLTGWWLLLLSRTVVGFGTGILSVVRACIADCTTVQQRTKFMAYSSAVQFIGFAVVPGAGKVLTYIDFKIGSFEVDQFTSTGFLLAIINLLMVVFVMIFLPNRLPMQPEPKVHKIAPPSQIEEKSASKVEESSIPKSVFYIGVGVFIALNLVARGVLALLEVTAAPVFLDAWDGSESDPVGHTSTMMLILGVVGLIIFALIEFMEKYIAEWLLLSISLFLIGAGGAVLYDWTGDGINLAEFLIGASLIWSIGSPIAQTIILSAFSKILGSKPQGAMMGWIGSAGSVGRIVFPLLSILGNNISFMISSGTAILSAIAAVVYNWRVQVAKRKLQQRDLLMVST
jgi:ceroid-lipofuscinosis MFS transporter 7